MEWLFPKIKFKWLAEEIRKNLPKELDFQQEAHNMEKVSSMLKHLSFLKVSYYMYLTTESGILYLPGNILYQCILFPWRHFVPMCGEESLCTRLYQGSSCANMKCSAT